MHTQRASCIHSEKHAQMKRAREHAHVHSRDAVLLDYVRYSCHGAPDLDRRLQQQARERRGVDQAVEARGAAASVFALMCVSCCYCADAASCREESLARRRVRASRAMNFTGSPRYELPDVLNGREALFAVDDEAQRRLRRIEVVPACVCVCRAREIFAAQAMHSLCSCFLAVQVGAHAQHTLSCTCLPTHSGDTQPHQTYSHLYMLVKAVILG